MADYAVSDYNGDSGCIFLREGVGSSSDIPTNTFAIQFFYPPTSQPCPWDFVKPGREIADARQDIAQDLVGGWMSKCVNEHTTCHRPVSSLPTRVIDVGKTSEDKVSLHISSGCMGQYAALSHCWGTHMPLQTTRKNLEEHCSSIAMTRLPQTFRDSVELCRMLNIRFLWIDSLCIIQDDPDDWEAEVSRMGKVYYDAHLVLAASQAKDSSGGLFNKLGESVHQSMHVGTVHDSSGAESKIHVNVTPIGNNIMLHWHSMALLNSPLACRAWALQEHILASKIVHFTRTEIYWECSSTVACECMIMDHSQAESECIRRERIFRPHSTKEEYLEGPFSHSIPESSSLLWLELLSKYFSRHTTYESDRLPAIAGLASYLKSHGASEYIGGLWKKDLARSLLWTAIPTVRRDPRRVNGSPTWSPFCADLSKNTQKQTTISFGWSGGHDIYPFELKYFIHDIDVHCTPSRPDPFGRISSGMLRLRGKTLPIRSLDHGDRVTFARLGHNDTSMVVYWDVDPHEVDKDRLYFLLVAQRTDRPETRGLLLQSCIGEELTYQRVAIACQNPDGAEEMAAAFDGVNETELTII
ncbi:HET-domain-containing protein [Pseudovirgaria hyperparasitica]|uniref:HET-domain-containing protein n=1 Tax=Pseudovirgaria hyperparasitica TaxID=470096 RepID=A0A6A6WMT0_9PEZI|nr:HET-domain-containing protein [Pseudovirgaria hyperparasitica]KAF2763329.1 HET-domain-containing protein [Pseudovirgaria hyperparasitica]